MCLDARLLTHKLVNMNMNQNDKVFQNSELNFRREKEHVWGPHVLDTIFLAALSSSRSDDVTPFVHPYVCNLFC